MTTVALMAAGTHAMSLTAPALAEQGRQNGAATEHAIVRHAPTAASDGLPVPVLIGGVVLAFAVGLSGGVLHRRRVTRRAARPAPVATVAPEPVEPVQPAPPPPEPVQPAPPPPEPETPPPRVVAPPLAPVPPPPAPPRAKPAARRAPAKPLRLVPRTETPRPAPAAKPPQAAPEAKPPQPAPEAKPPQPAPEAKPSRPAPAVKPSRRAPAVKPSRPAPAVKPSRPAPATKPPQPAPATKPSRPAPAVEPPRPAPAADAPLTEAPERPRAAEAAASEPVLPPLTEAPEALRVPPSPEAQEPELPPAGPARRFSRVAHWPDEATDLWTCELDWKAGYRKANFRAMVSAPGSDKRRSLGESTPVRWALMGEPEPPTPELAVRVRALVETLEAAGWEHIGRGRRWYEQRFLWRGDGDPQPVAVPAGAEQAEN